MQDSERRRAEKISITKQTARAEKVRLFVELNTQFIEEAKVTPTATICQRYNITVSFYRILLQQLDIQRNEELLKQLADEAKRQSMQSSGVGKARATKLEKYGTDQLILSDKTKKKISKAIADPDTQEQRKQSLILSKGTANNWHKDTTPQPQNQPASELAQQHKSKIVSLLKHYGIEFEVDFMIDGHSYDIRAGRYLIQFNASITHSYLSKNAEQTITRGYHLFKWRLAKEHGFEQLSLFDWTDEEAFIQFVLSKFETGQLALGARKLSVKEVSKAEANQFLDKNHVLHSCKGNAINLALVDTNSQIMSLMTFGKPRFAKDCEFELLRFASLNGFNVQGAASKLFTAFTRQHPTAKIITYSDNNLGNGGVYGKLAFAEDGQTGPAVVWCNINNKHTVKDVSLIMQGADRLLGGYLKDKYFKVGLNKLAFEHRGGKEEYSKEYAEHSGDPDWWPGNQDIMLHYGYFPVADCGATRWLYTPSKASEE